MSNHSLFKSNSLCLLLVIIFLVGVLAVRAQDAVPSPTVISTPTPTVTPTPLVDDTQNVQPENLQEVPLIAPNY